MDYNTDAVFEIANYVDEKYLMVIHESKLEYKKVLDLSKESILDEFVNTISNNLNESFNSTAKIYDFSFKNYNAKKIEIEGESDGVFMIWHTIAVESSLNLFQICYWTVQGDNSQEKLTELYDITKTFKIN